MKFTAETYQLSLPQDRPFVYLEDPQGNRIADLFLYSSVHPVVGRDDTVETASCQVSEQPGETVLTWTVLSSAWRRKTVRLRCLPRRLIYEIEVEGSGQLCEVNYFGGYFSGQARWGSGFFWSGQRFARGFNPEPAVEEVYAFDPSAGSVIDLTGVPLPGKGGWFFTPPPFQFAFQAKAGWMGMAVEARPGANTYTDYGYHGRRGGFYLSLTFEGYTQVSGHYVLPSIAFDFGDSPYAVLSEHTQALRVAGWAPAVSPSPRPAWWFEPIFCGWGAQCSLAAREKGKAPAYARQEHYEAFLNTLNAHQISPGIVVLDDKWQATYGNNQVDEDKWPDLPGFIQSQHALGRKVLLWLKAWDPEGVPVEECVTNSAGLPVSVDPTNPAFEQRLRASVRRMLSAVGYDADGFKIDFTARIPSGPGFCHTGSTWGLELMRLYLWILYDEAKQAKSDALVMAHTPHPYLADVLDMVRLNDANQGTDINRAMIHRSRVASIACPSALIDTDNWPMTNRAAWRRYMRAQEWLGIPSLYYTDRIDTTQEPLTEGDYRLIRAVWRRHRQKQAASGGESRIDPGDQPSWWRDALQVLAPKRRRAALAVARK